MADSHAKVRLFRPRDYDNNGYSENKIIADGRNALLLFGAMFTALSAGAATLLAESWFETLRQFPKVPGVSISANPTE